jgi:hypothetical protein
VLTNRQLLVSVEFSTPRRPGAGGIDARRNAAAPALAREEKYFDPDRIKSAISAGNII